MKIPDPFETPVARRCSGEPFAVAQDQGDHGLSWPEKPEIATSWPETAPASAAVRTFPPITSVHHVCKGFDERPVPVKDPNEKHFDFRDDQPVASRSRPRRTRRLGGVWIFVVAACWFALGAQIGSDRITSFAKEIRVAVSRFTIDDSLNTPQTLGTTDVDATETSHEFDDPGTTNVELATPAVSDSLLPPLAASSRAAAVDSMHETSFQAAARFAMTDHLLAQAKDEHRPVLFVIDDEPNDDRILDRWEQFVAWPSPYRTSLREIVEDFVVVPVTNREARPLGEHLGQALFPGPDSSSPFLVIARSDGQPVDSIADLNDRQQLIDRLQQASGRR